MNPIDPLRLLTLAKALGEMHLSHSTVAISQWKLEKDIEARKLALLPSDGWPGKNEEQRKTAAQQAYLADEPLRKMDAEWDLLRAQLSAIDANVAALEAERKAIEWIIRAQLVDALAARHIQFDGTEDAFDQAADARMDTQMDAALVDADPLDDDLPF